MIVAIAMYWLNRADVTGAVDCGGLGVNADSETGVNEVREVVDERQRFDHQLVATSC